MTKHSKKLKEFTGCTKMNGCASSDDSLGKELVAHASSFITNALDQ